MNGQWCGAEEWGKERIELEREKGEKGRSKLHFENGFRSI
jgi:hypothetical protein